MELKNLEKRRAVEAKLRKGIWEREKMIEEERREKEAQLQREREERCVKRYGRDRASWHTASFCTHRPATLTASPFFGPTRERLRQQETEEERALREKREDEEFEAHLLRKYGVEDLEVEDAPPLVVGEPIIWPRRPLPDDITEPEASALLGEVRNAFPRGACDDHLFFFLSLSLSSPPQRVSYKFSFFSPRRH